MTHTLWSDMFQLGIPLVEKIVRPVAVYVFLVVGFRLAGKRELAQLNPFDLIVLLTISNTVQNAIIGEDNSVTGGLVGAATLLAVNAAVVRFVYRHERIERLIEGEPDVLIEDGQIKQDRLTAELVTMSELESAARKQGFASLAEVDKAILEPGGTITFAAKKPTPDALRMQQLTARLDEICQQLATLAAARS